MANTSTRTGLQLRSTVKRDGILELSLVSVATPEPKLEEVIVRIDASPINPSDQGLLFGGADMSTAKASGTAVNPVVTTNISSAVMKTMAGRLDQSLPVGNDLLEALSGVRLVVTLENHAIEGGLGSLVAEALVEARPSSRLLRIGVATHGFPPGSPSYLRAGLGLDGPSLARRPHASFPIGEAGHHGVIVTRSSAPDLPA